MPDEVVDAAHQYAVHSLDCKTCQDCGNDLCPDGLALLERFQSALHGMLAQPKTKYDA